MKLFNEQGFLNEDGKKYFRAHLDESIDCLLINAKSEDEIRILGSLISNYVGNIISNKINELNRSK